MKNLDLIDKLVYITDLARGKAFDMGGDYDTVQQIDAFESELIEALSK